MHSWNLSWWLNGVNNTIKESHTTPPLHLQYLSSTVIPQKNVLTNGSSLINTKFIEALKCCWFYHLWCFSPLTSDRCTVGPWTWLTRCSQHPDDYQWCWRWFHQRLDLGWALNWWFLGSGGQRSIRVWKQAWYEVGQICQAGHLYSQSVLWFPLWLKTVNLH